MSDELLLRWASDEEDLSLLLVSPFAGQDSKRICAPPLGLPRGSADQCKQGRPGRALFVEKLVGPLFRVRIEPDRERRWNCCWLQGAEKIDPPFDVIGLYRQIVGYDVRETESAAKSPVSDTHGRSIQFGQEAAPGGGVSVENDVIARLPK